MNSLGLANSKRVRASRITSVDGQLKLSGKDRGFTIIELLVVMAIIGLLAAIAIPVFSKLKNNAYDSAAQSDLRQAAIQTESQFTTTGAYPAANADFVTNVMSNVKLTTGGTVETVLYTKGSLAGANGYTISINDTRSGSTFCYQSSAGGLTKVANVAACTTAAANN